MRSVFLLLAATACSEFQVLCAGDRTPVTRAEAERPTDCDNSLCLHEIVASNHLLLIKAGTSGCSAEEPTPSLSPAEPCDHDYVVLKNRGSGTEYLEDYTLVRDDISYAADRLDEALPWDEVLDDPDEIHLLHEQGRAVDAVGPEKSVLLFTERREGAPRWMVPHDMGSEWGTVRLQKNGCEVDHVYYGKVASEPHDLDGDGKTDIEEDRAWRRMKTGCSDPDASECWRLACPTYLPDDVPCTLPEG